MRALQYSIGSGEATFSTKTSTECLAVCSSSRRTRLRHDRRRSLHWPCSAGHVDRRVEWSTLMLLLSLQFILIWHFLLCQCKISPWFAALFPFPRSSVSGPHGCGPRCVWQLPDDYWRRRLLPAKLASIHKSSTISGPTPRFFILLALRPNMWRKRRRRCRWIMPSWE